MIIELLIGNSDYNWKNKFITTLLLIHFNVFHSDKMLIHMGH